MMLAQDGPRLRLFTEQADPPAPSSTRLVWVMLLVVLAGLALRAGCYLRNQSLWIDEAMLALNVVYRPSAELLQPLDLNQGAPLGYLLSSKLLIQLFGSSELALRSGSFLAGVLGLALFVPLAYQLLPLAAARIAIVGYSLSPYLIGYCAEFKQYELDATIAVALLASHWRLLTHPSRTAVLGNTLLGAVALWCSHPALFLLAALGSLSLIDAQRTRQWAQLRLRGLMFATWATSFLLAYFLFLRKLGLNDYLLTYWSGQFMPFPPKSPGDLAWIAHHLLQFFEKPGGFGTREFALSGLAAFCAACGLLHLVQNHWRLAVALVGPIVLALAASALKKYPFAGRLLLFAVPLLILLTAYGAAQLFQMLQARLRPAGWGLLALLALPLVAQCQELVKKPLHAEEAREMLRFVHDQWQEGDRLYVYYGAVPAVAYYHPRYPIPREAVLFGQEARQKFEPVFQAEWSHFQGSTGRLWIIFAHRQPTEESAVRGYLAALGTIETCLRGQDASVLLFTP